MADFNLTGAIVGEQGGQILDFFTQYSAQAASAAAGARALANPSAQPNTQAQVADLSPRTITLSWETPTALPGTPPNLLSSTQGGSNVVPASTTVPSTSPGLKEIAHVVARNKYFLTFDVNISPRVDGHAQSISYTATSRQNIKQTVLGFHVDEFGMAPGRVDLDAVVLLRGQSAQQIQKIFDFLNKQKMTQPLDTTKPGVILKYFDSYLGRSFIISQESLQISETAGEQNRARLVIRAAILKDYSNPSSNGLSQQSTSAQQLLTAQQAATSVLTALTDFADGAGGAITFG